MPEADSFKCPLVPLIPCLGILGNFYLTTGVDSMSWVYFMIFELIGLSFYFGYGFTHSRLNKFHKKVEEDSIVMFTQIQNQ